LPVIGSKQRFFFSQILRYEAGGDERRKLFEGAVDGIGTIWASSGSRTPTQEADRSDPALPNRAVAFKMVADALHSGDFPAPAAIGHRNRFAGRDQRKPTHHAPAYRRDR